MSPESGAIDFGKLLGNFWEHTKDILGEIAYREGAKVEGVRDAIDAAKIKEGKNLLWKVFPFMIIGIVGLWAFTKG